MNTGKNIIITGVIVMAGLLPKLMILKADAAPFERQTHKTMKKVPAVISHFFTSQRVTTHYWEAGPSDGPLMIFVHGWPEIGLVWRAQMEDLAAEGWRCIAPDLRGFGSSSVFKHKEAYAIQKVVKDMTELHAYLGGNPAIWVGHDWGSPIVAALVAHHPEASRGVVLVSVPYFPKGWALPNLLTLIDRTLYPADQYPDGQWDHWRFYLTHFEQAVSDMEADIPATLAFTFSKGNPSTAKKISPTAFVSANGGRYGAARRAPATKPDYTLWPQADFEVLVEAFKKTGFRPCDSYYLNDEANLAYANTSVDSGKLSQPVLFINDEYESFCNINLSKIGDPMRKACSNLSVIDEPSGHYLPLERKHELTQRIRSWLELNELIQSHHQ